MRRTGPRGRAAYALLLGLLAPVGCHRSPDGAQQGPAAGSASARVLEAADDVPALDGGTARREAARAAGERVAIAAGSFLVGSMPGDAGRDPPLEPPLLRVELGAFEIDRLPYPNDPQAPPRTGVDRAQAEQLCSERGGRLCTEIEWERACKGPDSQPFAGAARWDPACATAPTTCASGYGVLGLGAALRELTASEVAPVKNLLSRAAAVRGAAANAAEVDHRCAHRSALEAGNRADDLGFRCCYGARNEAVIPSPEWLEPFRPFELPPSELGTMLQGIPKLSHLAADVKYFREDAAIESVEKRGQSARQVKGLPDSGERASPSPSAQPRDEEDGVDLAHGKKTTAPLLWSPVPGEEILVVTGRSGAHSFIVAFHRLADEHGESRYRVGSAFLLENEPGPVVLVYDPSARRRMHWMTCQGCYGESGRIRYGEDNRVVITQH